MKHLRIYESYRGDKVIKLYNNSILYDYQVDVEESTKRIVETKNKILTLINEYINMNSDYFLEKYGYLVATLKIKNFEFYIDKTPSLSLCYSYAILANPEDNIYLKYKDIEDLLNFMKDPDLYRSMKKYNI